MENKKYKLLYNWRSGKYWGFGYLINKRFYIFDSESNNKGWIDSNNKAWDMNGDYIGDLVDEHYILRRDFKVEPISKIGRFPRNKPAQPQQTGPKKPREKLVGYYDVLENL
jgi:hypothetical protein